MFNKYAENRPKDAKMFSSGFFPNSEQNSNDLERFPAFNIKPANNKVPATETDTNAAKIEKRETAETPEEKRRREIMEIKKQLDEINKKMEMKNASNQNNKNEPNLVRPKNSGVAQSMIFPGSNASSFQSNYNLNSNNLSSNANSFNVNKVTPNTHNNEGSSLSALDKLYEQKKTQQQQPSFRVEKVEKPTIMEQNPNTTKIAEDNVKKPIISSPVQTYQKPKEITTESIFEADTAEQSKGKQLDKFPTIE